MDPSNILFNVLFVEPTNSGKGQFLVNQLCGPYRGKFDYIVHAHLPHLHAQQDLLPVC